MSTKEVISPTIADILTLTGLKLEDLTAIAEAELKHRRMKEFLLTEPFSFYKEKICPIDKIEYLRPFHKTGLEWVNRKGGKRFKLLLWPRGHLKSSIFTQGETVRLSLLNPNSRHLINSSTVDPIGHSFLKAIKGHFADPRIVSDYGDLLPNPRSGKIYRNNEDELTLLSRTDNTIKEPTVTVSGLDRTKTSQHYDRIVHDDLVVRENVGNPEMMDKVWKVWQDSLDLLEPDGTMLVIGTRWHPLDLYGRIIADHVDKRCFDGEMTKHVANCKCKFDVYVLKLQDEAGHYIFDSKFDEDIANELRSIKTQREFSAQYENNPYSEEAAWFKKAEIDASLISPEEINAIREKLTWYMMVDPAESMEARSSYTAIVCVGVDFSTGELYVDFAKQCKVDTAGFVTEIFDAVNTMNPSVFGMEKKTRKALEYVLKDKMSVYGRFFNIEDLNPAMGNAPNAKEVRIRSLRPLFEAGRIKINNTLKDLLDILYTIPSSMSMDLPDALSYIFQLVPGGLGGDHSALNNLPTRVVQNKGLVYATRRIIDPNAQFRASGRSRARIEQEGRRALQRIYAPLRFRYRGKRSGS